MSATTKEIQESLYGRRKGARIRVKEDPAERMADGIVFASKREMLRYRYLVSMVHCGIFHNLELQPAFPIVINGVKCCIYKADFRYKDLDGRTVIEDVKGFSTEIYKLKKKLVEAQYGVRIIET